MREPITVAVAQPLCVAHDVASNALAHAAAVRSARARVVVFPELSLTGYELDAPALDVGDDRLAPIVDACAETRSLALVGAPIADDTGASYIATLAVDGTGVSVAYRKLYVGSDEAARFAPGDEPVALLVDGWRLGLAICRDIGILEHRTRTCALGIDAYLAGTVEDPEGAARQDERALQIATQFNVWVAIASFAGATGGGYEQTAGGSSIRAPDGTVLTQLGREPGAIAHATLR